MFKLFKIKLYISIIAVILANITFAQDNNPVEMANGMRSNGKIYVVVAVVTTILLIIFAYLFRLEKKIKNLDK